MKPSRRHFLKSLLIAGAGLAGAGFLSLNETNELDIHTLELTLPHLPPEFDGYRIIQLTDIHMGTGMTEKRLLEIVGIVNGQQPDLIALTGDYVTLGSVEAVADALIRPLRRLVAKDRVVAVMGNHDHHANVEQMREVLIQINALELSNDVFTLERSGARLNIAGVDDAWYEHDRLDVVLDKLPDERGAILLMHEPDYADLTAPTGRFDLQMSGHSHGGQIVLPTGPLALPRLGEKYYSGLYQVGDMIQYTNRGVGTSVPPIRINCPPEITVFTLRTPVV